MHEVPGLLIAVATSALVLLTAPPNAGADVSASPRVGVVVGKRAPELECFAARELCGYLRMLFGVSSRPSILVPPEADVLFLVGNPVSNESVAEATVRRRFPPVTDQGLVLRRLQFGKRPALLIGGGSPQATLWAVYELVERWGVRYLLHGDVLPPRRSLVLPDVDVTMEPELRVRQWRVVNDFAMGPESWGIDDYRPVLGQLAKLKFNRIFVSIWPYQPFLDLQVRGVRRKHATLWYDFHYPITDDMIGRRLFEGNGEFWNPDLPLHASYADLAAAGERHIHAIITYARERGMQTVMSATLTEFPPEFAPLLPGAQKVHQLGEMGIVPGPDTPPDAPEVTDLAAAVLRATADTYPEVDCIALGMPEFRQWSGAYERAWRALDAKYDIESMCPLAKVVAAAQSRPDYPGGSERAVQEVKGDIVALYFYDRLLTDLKVLNGSRHPEVRVALNCVAEELFPVLSRIAPPGSETLNIVDYTPSRVLKRRAALKAIPARDIPSALIYTLHDDNVGVLPQLMTGSLHELTLDLKRYGWQGFSTRYWLIGDHDPCLAYLSQAAWHPDATPQAVYRDQLRAVCGEACVDDMLTVFREVEATTVQLEWHGLGLTFTVPGMMMKHWTPEPMPAELVADREGYRRALAAACSAQMKCMKHGRAYVDYWIGRLEFGIGYLDAVEALRRAAIADAAGKRAEALVQTRASLAAATRALEAYAAVARDRSDLGAIAVMNEYVYRPLKAKVAELESRDP